jgi:predicted transcriptional regulator
MLVYVYHLGGFVGESSLDEKQERRIKALALVMRALSNETRLKILNLLNKSPMTNTQMQLELKINAKSLQNHLQYLQDRNLITKSEQIGFKLTRIGKMLLEISMKDMLTVIELGD